MVKAFCDRCGAEIPVDEPVEKKSFVDGYGIIKVENGSDGWHFVELCPKCQDVFREFLKLPNPKSEKTVVTDGLNVMYTIGKEEPI